MLGSVVNRILETRSPQTIEVGMGATVCHWSDRSPCSVVEVIRDKDGNVKEIGTVGDHVGPNLVTWPAQKYEITPFHREGQKYERIDGVLRRMMPGASGWDHNPVPVQIWRKDSKGRFRSTYVNESGRRVMAAASQSAGISLGDRDYYQDPSF